MQRRRWSTLLIYVVNFPSLQEFVIIRVLEEPWSAVTWRWGSILSKIASLWSALARSVSYQTLRRQDAAYEINKARKACLCFWDYEVSDEDVFLASNVKLPWSDTRSLWSAKQKYVTSWTTNSKFFGWYCYCDIRTYVLLITSISLSESRTSTSKHATMMFPLLIILSAFSYLKGNAQLLIRWIKFIYYVRATKFWLLYTYTYQPVNAV